MMWERVVPASSRMIEFLAREQEGSTDRLISAFQLMRFHLCRNDLRSAKVSGVDWLNCQPSILHIYASLVVVMVCRSCWGRCWTGASQWRRQRS